MIAEARSLAPSGRRAERESGDSRPELDLPSARSELVGLLVGTALLAAKGRGR